MSPVNHASRAEFNSSLVSALVLLRFLVSWRQIKSETRSNLQGLADISGDKFDRSFLTTASLKLHRSGPSRALPEAITEQEQEIRPFFVVRGYALRNFVNVASRKVASAFFLIPRLEEEERRELRGYRCLSGSVRSASISTYPLPFYERK
jgi:hypothetical protein